MTRAVILISLALMLGACTMPEVPQLAEPARPDQAAISRAVARAYYAADLTGPAQMSPLRRAHIVSPGNWVVCLRADQPVTYAVYMMGDQYTMHRVAVGIDQCGLQDYAPFDVPAREQDDTGKQPKAKAGQGSK